MRSRDSPSRYAENTSTASISCSIPIFTPEEIEYIYTNLGNGINHELCMKFVKSGYDLKVIEESV